ncbi:hypothetical protein FPOAC2_10276 [Fusarium poae]
MPSPSNCPWLHGCGIHNGLLGGVTESLEDRDIDSNQRYPRRSEMPDREGLSDSNHVASNEHPQQGRVRLWKDANLACVGDKGSTRQCRSGRLSVAVVFGEGLLDSCWMAFTSGDEEQREQVGASCLKSRVAKSRAMRWARMMVNYDQ